MPGNPSHRARALCATAVAGVLAISINAAVSAKMPFFTAEITTPSPVEGEPIVIAVRTWADVGHTSSVSFEDVGSLDGLLVVRPTGRGGGDILVPLRPREPDRFEGSVTLPAGDWVLVAFPDRSGWGTPEIPAGYPDTMSFSVRKPGVDPRAVVIPLLAIGVLLAGAISRRQKPTFWQIRTR
jgi:hypothetical protein